jgi:hypothetical protein
MPCARPASGAPVTESIATTVTAGVYTAAQNPTGGLSVGFEHASAITPAANANER